MKNIIKKTLCMALAFFMIAGIMPVETFASDEEVFTQSDSEMITIIYDANGGYDAPESQSFPKGEEFTITMEAPSHDKYKFIGWSLSPRAIQPEFWREYTFETDEYYGDEVVLYAVWACEVEIEFDANGGTGAPANQKVWNNHETYAPQAPTRNGYEFVAWQGEIFINEDGESLSYFDLYDEGGYIGTGRAGQYEKIVLKAIWKKNDETWANFYFKDATVAPGKTAKLEIFVENNDGTDVNWWTLNYPYSGGEYFEIENFECYEIEGDGVIACFNIKVSEDALESAYAFSLNLVNSYNDEGELRVYKNIVGTIIVDKEAISEEPEVPPVADKYFFVEFDFNGGKDGPGDFNAKLSNDPYDEYAIFDIPEKIPTKEGYTFVGWQQFENGVLSEAHRAGEKHVTIWSDIVLRAVWQKNDVPVPVITAKSVTATPGEKASVKFYIENNGRIEVSDMHIISIDGVYNGQWEITDMHECINVNYSHTLYGDGLFYELIFSINEDAAPGTYNYLITFPDGINNELESFIFMDIPFTITVEEDIVVTPSYKITYDANGGTGAPAEQYKEEGKDLVISSQIPKKEGYVFLAWQFMHPFTQGTYMEILPGEAYPFDASMKLTAVWAREECNIIFKGESVPESYQIEGGSTFTFPEAEREGYKFLGWETRAENWKEGYTVMRQPGFRMRVTENMELTAVWEKVEEPETDILYGDVNNDGRINILDANLTRRCAAKLIEFSADQVKTADVDGNERINVLDANLIRRYAAKIIDEFPIEGK